MSFTKDFIYPTLVRIIAALVIAWIGFRYLQHKNFLKSNSRNELVTSYKNSNITLTKSLKTLERIHRETKHSFFIRSDYLLNQIDAAIETNGDFIDSQLVIEVYGDSLSRPIFDTIATILTEIDDDLFRYKRRRELLQESTAKICNSSLNKKSYILKRHINNLDRIIAEENYLRRSLLVRCQELICLRRKMREDFKRYLNEDYNPKIKNEICVEEQDQRYSRYYDIDHPYYNMYKDSQKEPPLHFQGDKKVDSINIEYAKIIVELSMQSCAQ